MSIKVGDKFKLDMDASVSRWVAFVLQDTTEGTQYTVDRVLEVGDETQGDFVDEPGIEFRDDVGDLVSIKLEGCPILWEKDNG